MGEAFVRMEAGPLRLHVLPTKRFKTYAVSLYAGLPLSEETATPTALAPFVMRRGTARLPETAQFRQYLEDMYGSGFGFDVYKRGDYQLVQFRMDTIQDRYVGGGSLLEETLRFLSEALTAPAMEDGQFVSRYVEEEKDTLRKRLDAIVNDKVRYAAERCLEEMFRGTPFRLHALGERDRIDAITAAGLTAAYRDWLNRAIFDLYVVGDVSPDEVAAQLARFVPLEKRASASVYAPSAPAQARPQPQTVEEMMDVSQAKLNMAFAAPARFGDADYAAALVFNGVFGGYAHSKLFMNVREKASLAYYASSRLDGHKGVLTVQSGIESRNADKARAIIAEQLDAIRRGEISDLEMAQTKAVIRNQIREMADSAFEIVAFDFNSVLTGREASIDEIVGQVEAVAVADVQAFAERVALDTTYLLRERKGE